MRELRDTLEIISREIRRAKREPYSIELSNADIEQEDGGAFIRINSMLEVGEGSSPGTIQDVAIAFNELLRDDKILAIDGGSEIISFNRCKVAVACVYAFLKDVNTIFGYPNLSKESINLPTDDLMPYIAFKPVDTNDDSKVKGIIRRRPNINDVKEFREYFYYTDAYDTSTMTNEIRTDLENYMLKYCIKKFSNYLIIIDGPLFYIPSILKDTGRIVSEISSDISTGQEVRRAAACIYVYINVYLRLLSDRIKLLNECYHNGIEIVGVVKRIENAKYLARSLGIPERNDVDVLEGFVERLLIRGDPPYKPLAIGPIKLELNVSEPKELIERLDTYGLGEAIRLNMGELLKQKHILKYIYYIIYPLDPYDKDFENFRYFRVEIPEWLNDRAYEILQRVLYDVRVGLENDRLALPDTLKKVDRRCKEEVGGYKEYIKNFGPSILRTSLVYDEMIRGV